MSKDKDPLFDDLIEALEAMSGEAQDDAEDGAAPAQPDAIWAPAASRTVRGSSLRSGAASGAMRPSVIERISQASRAMRSRLLSLADVRTVARMSVLLVVAGAVTLFFITRPYTSGPADARNGADPASLVAKTHTELERVVIRGMHDPSHEDQHRVEVQLPPIEPARIDIEALPTASLPEESRRVRIQNIRLDRPELVAALPKPAVPASVARDVVPDVQAAIPEKAAAPSPEAETAYKHGIDLLKRKDVAAARLMLKRAADRGHAEAALALAETHDASQHSAAAGIGIYQDDEVARKYYAIARDLGLDKAADRLTALGASGQ